MSNPLLSDEEETALVDALLDTLEAVVKTSGCRDMVPLWLIASAKPRAEHLRQVGKVQGVPEHIRGWKAPKRSKYAALAGWRHAVLLADALPTLDVPHRAAVEGMYFTPFERNEPPYSWSEASSRAPSAGDWPSVTMFDQRARQGCRLIVDLLKNRVEQSQSGATFAEEARTAFVAMGTRKTLADVLRFDQLRRPER